MTVDEHVIEIKECSYFSSGRIYVAECSCGNYESGKKVIRLAAETAGSSHVRAKRGQPVSQEANGWYGIAS